MDGIRMTAAALCITVAVTAILLLLLPNGKYRGVMQFSISLFLLCGLIAPFVNADFSFSFTLPETQMQDRREETAEAVERYFLAMTKERIENVLCDGLKAGGYSFEKIAVKIHTENEQSIYIKQITVTGAKEEEIAAIRSYILAQSGVEPDFMP